MTSATTFPPGETVVLREVLDGRVRSARPLRIVADDAEGVAGYLVPRSRVAWPRLLGGAQSQTPDQGWLLPEEEWFGPGSLYVIPPGSGFAAVLFFDPVTREPLGWKIDFLRPPVRTTVGFDTLDHAFDLLAELDLSAWHSKDVDDLAQLRRVAVLDDDELARVDEAAGRAVELMQRRHSPFDDRWLRWRPDAGWPSLELPAGWDHIDVPAGDAGASPGPLGWRSAQGVEVLTADGRRVFDLDLDGGTLPCGHAHPAIVEAVARQAPLGWSLGPDHPAITRLSDELLANDAEPAGRRQVRWFRSGEEARAWVERTRAASAAHGTHLMAADPVIDLVGRLAEGWPHPRLAESRPHTRLDAAGATVVTAPVAASPATVARPDAVVVFGDDLFAGFGGGAVVVPSSLADRSEPHVPSAIAAVAALETLRQLAGDGPAAAAAAGQRIRDALGFPGEGPWLELPAATVAAAALVGVHVGATGHATIPTTTTTVQADELIERLRRVRSDSNAPVREAQPVAEARPAPEELSEHALRPNVNDGPDTAERPDTTERPDMADTAGLR